MSTNYRRFLVIGGLFVSYIFYELSLVLLVAFVTCVVLCLMYFAPSAQGYNRTLGLSCSPTSTVTQKLRAGNVPQMTNIKYAFPSENVDQNQLVLSTPWGMTASSAVLRRRGLAGKTTSSYDGNRILNLVQHRNQTSSAAMLHRPPTTNNSSLSGGLSTQILSAAFPPVQQPRCGSLGVFPTVNLNPQPLPFLRERNTNMIHSSVMIKVGPPATVSPVRVDYTYNSNVKRSPVVEAVIATLGTRKRTCMSSNVEDANEHTKRQRREEIATSREDFAAMNPAPSVLNGMLRSTANILMQQSVGSGSQKRRFDGSAESISIKRNRNNEISSSYSSSRRSVTQKKKRRMSRSSSPSVKIDKGEQKISDDGSIAEEQSSIQGILSSPVPKLLATSTSCCSIETSSIVQSETSESSPPPISEKLPSIPVTPWTEGFSRKRQLPVYASVSASNISKPLYIPEGSASVDDEKRDQQANQIRLNKIMSSVKMAFDAKTEKLKLQRTPVQDIFSRGIIKSPAVPSPLTLGSTDFTTSTPVTSIQASLPPAASITTAPTLSLNAVLSSGGILSVVPPATINATPNTSLPALGGVVTCATNSTPTSSLLVSPSLNFGFTATSTQSHLPVMNSVPKSNDSLIPSTQSGPAIVGTTLGIGTTVIVPLLTSNVTQVTATSDPLPLGGLANSASILTSAPSSSLPMSLFSTSNSAAAEQKPTSFQLTTPTNLFQFSSPTVSNATATKPSSNPPLYSASESTSATTSMGITSATFPTFAFAALGASSVCSSQLSSVNTTTTATPQFGFNTASSTTTAPSFALTAPLTSTQKSQELGVPGLINATPFTTSSFGVQIITGDKTSAFSFQNTTPVATTAPTLQFGSASTNFANSNNTPVCATLASPYGSGTIITTTPSVNALNKPSIPATPFFQVSSTGGQTAPAQPKPLLQFGGSSATSNMAPSFQFGQNIALSASNTSSVTSVSHSAPAFTFGQNPTNTSVANPVMQFGQNLSTSEVNSAIKPGPASTLFQFGPTNVTVGSSNVSSGSTFNFGNANTGFGVGGNTGVNVSGCGGGGFTFALSSAVNPSASSFQPTVTSSSSFFTQQNSAVSPNLFGTATAPSYGFGTGTASTTILSNGSNLVQPRTVGSVFQFGTSASTQPAAANPPAAFNFAAQPQQTSTGGFNFIMGTTPDLTFGGGNRNTVSSSSSISSTRRAAQARRRINR